MATLVDSLVISLGLDASNFNQEQRRAVEQLRNFKGAVSQTSKEVEAEGKRAAQFFSQVKTEALSLIGVLVGAGGLEAFIRDTTQSLAKLGDQAMHVGVAAPQLAAFANMIARQGGNAQTAAAQFVSLTDAMEAWKLSGSSPMAAAAGSIGIDRNDNALTALEKFQAFVEKTADVAKVNFVGKALGLDQGTIDAVVRMKTLAKMHEELAHSYELGVPTPEMTQRAKDFQEALAGLGQAAEHDGDLLLNKMYPGLTHVADSFARLIEQKPEMLALFGGIGGYLVAWSLLNFGALTAVLGRFVALAPLWALILATTTDGGAPAPTTPEEEEKRRADSVELGQQQAAQVAAAKKLWRDHAPTWLGGNAKNWDAVHDYFVSQGWSDAQASGLADTAQDESGIDPESFNPAGGGQGARGLFQWRADRIDRYRARYGHDPRQGSLQENLEFAQWELTHTEGPAGDFLRGAKTEQEARQLLRQYYTRPGTPLPNPNGVYHALPRPGLTGGGGGGNTNSNSVSVGTINVHTMATDATGIARDIGGALGDITITQANRGLS